MTDGACRAATTVEELEKRVGSWVAEVVVSKTGAVILMNRYKKGTADKDAVWVGRQVRNAREIGEAWQRGECLPLPLVVLVDALPS